MRNAASVSAAPETLNSVVLSLYERLLLAVLLVLSVKSSVVVSVKLFVVVPLVVLSIVPLLVTLSAGFASVALYADFVVDVVVFGVSVAVPAVVTVPAFVVVRVPVLVFVAVFWLSSVSAPL